MDGKKTGTRFTIQFRETDPAHLRVAELLNNQGYRGKAQYLVNAVLHYEAREERTEHSCLTEIDEALVEAVVIRVLRDRGELADKPVRPPALPASSGEDILLDEAVEAIGTDALRAITGALDMFRKK
jgi:hypothetical protein